MMKTFIYTFLLISFSSLLFVSCGDDDQPITTITTSDVTASVDENSADGTVIATVNATTSDDSQAKFTIVSQSVANAIAINENTGELTINDTNAFDYETNTTITGTIDITAGNAGTKSANFTININDVYGKKVLIAGAQGLIDQFWIEDVQTKIKSTNLFETVDVANIHTATPTTEDLKKYDMVLVWTNYPPENQKQIGNNLAEFIEAGCAVVGATFEASSTSIQGNYHTKYKVYDITQSISYTSGYKRSYDSTKSDTTHPILKNISSYNGGSDSYYNTNLKPSTGATVVAMYDNDEPFILVKEFADYNTRGVYLNMFSPSSDARSGYWDATTDGALLMANALKWAGDK